jgi:hypothetical protein
LLDRFGHRSRTRSADVVAAQIHTGEALALLDRLCCPALDLPIRTA